MTPRLILLAIELAVLVAARIGARIGSEWSARRSFCALLVIVFAIAAVGSLADLAALWVIGKL
jgi:hypothetical protein